MSRFIILLLCFFFSSVWLWGANTGDTAEFWEGVPIPVEQCNTVYKIAGPTSVKAWSSHEYSIESMSGTEFVWGVIYTLIRDWESVEVINDRQKYLRYFTNPGEVTLNVRLFPATEDTCEWILSTQIQVYNTSFVYVGSARAGLESGIREVFQKNNILYEGYEGASNIFAQMDDGKAAWKSIDQSDILVIGTQDVLGIFSDILKFQKTSPVSFAKKKIYIISDYSRSFLSKVIASSLSQLGATTVYLISEDQFYTLATRVSSGEEAPVLWEELSYEKSKTVYSLWGFLEFLAYSGFSYQLLAFLLSITFAVLVLNILKQVIGFSVFGIYYPILFAITIVALGFSGAFIFILIGFFSITLVNLFTKRVHLLLHAKRALLISLYILLFLLVLGIDNYFELSLIRYTLFDNSLIIFPFFVTIVLADKVFQDDIDIFSRYGLYDALQYAIITGIVYGLFEYKTLQYFLISYPDVIILVVFLNILVGRYVWLQMFEYFRFSSVLRKIDEEE